MKMRKLVMEIEYSQRIVPSASLIQIARIPIIEPKVRTAHSAPRKLERLLRS